MGILEGSSERRPERVPARVLEAKGVPKPQRKLVMFHCIGWSAGPLLARFTCDSEEGETEGQGH